MFIKLFIKGITITLDNVSVGYTVFIRVNDENKVYAEDDTVNEIVKKYMFTSQDMVVIKGCIDALHAGFTHQAVVDRQIFVD